MKGRTFLIWGGVFLAMFTAALWYTQFHAYYREMPAETVVMGVYPVSEWTGIDATSSPLKKRVCLRVSEETAQRIHDEQFELNGAEPLVAPGWFECFDARQIARDLEAGVAQFYLIGPSESEGVDEFLALYPDGRGYIWPQLQARYRAQ